MKTTAKHFQIFKKEAQGLVSAIGLRDYRLDFEHTNLDGCRGLSVWRDGNIATIYLSTDWGDDNVTEEKLRICTFHEVCHLLFAKFYDLATARFVMAGQIDAEAERLVRVMENVIWPQIRGAGENNASGSK